MTIQSLIIEDSKKNRENLTSLLSKYCPEIEIIGEAANITQGQELLSKLKPDLVFLDVRMPGGTAFDLLKQLKQISFEIIFITAYDEYALQAFQFNAVDYILKPIDFQELKKAVEKVHTKLDLKKENELLRNMVANENREVLDKRIPLPTENKVEFMPIKEIIRCQAESNYTRFYLKDKSSLLICKTLKEYEKALEPYLFIRVHQSHLVNLREIKAFVRRDNGYVELYDKSVIPVSKTRKEEVQRKLLLRE